MIMRMRAPKHRRNGTTRSVLLTHRVPVGECVLGCIGVGLGRPSRPQAHPEGGVDAAARNFGCAENLADCR
jgi:hypothetical protein